MHAFTPDAARAADLPFTDARVAAAQRAATAGMEFTTYPSVAPWPSDLRHEDGWDRIAAALFGAAHGSQALLEAVRGTGRG